MDVRLLLSLVKFAELFSREPAIKNAVLHSVENKVDDTACLDPRVKKMATTMLSMVAMRFVGESMQGWIAKCGHTSWLCGASM